MKKVILTLLLLIFVAQIVNASLGISPAFVDIDFVPGQEHVIKFTIVTDDPNSKIEIYLDGELAKYSKLSKEEITGTEIVIMTIKLPETLDVPGIHGVSINAREKISEQSFLGTRINIGTIVHVYVPYPGKYIEPALSIPDVNLHDDIPVELLAYNRGKQNLFVNVLINFFKEGGEPEYQMDFENAQINVSQKRYFRKFLNSSIFKPGNYVANAIVDFGEIISVNKSFRIGSLNVNVTNYTRELPKGGIQKYYVEIQSLWNNGIKEVFADVNISNETSEFLFRTPSSDLDSWKKVNLEGYIDTSELEGKYDVEIILSYLGEKTIEKGSLFVYQESKIDKIYIIGGLLVVVLIVIIYIIFWKKHKRKNIKRRKIKK